MLDPYLWRIQNSLSKNNLCTTVAESVNVNENNLIAEKHF